MKTQQLLSAGLLLALGVGSVHGQSPGELKALQKRLAALEAKTNRLEDENRKLLDSNLHPEARSADKIKLSGPLKELSLYGTIGLRYQWNSSQNQLPVINARGDLVNAENVHQSRWRYRLVLNADFKLSDNWFGGVGLTSQNLPDSGYQDLANGFNNYNLYISRAFVGWNATDWLTFIGGKQANPFYRTDLTWDSAITPAGIVEQVKFHKLFNWGGGGKEEITGYTKDGKAIVSSTSAGESPFELTLIAGQLFFWDNPENAFDNDDANDSYIFAQQLVASYKFNKSVKATIAPAYLAYNAANANPTNARPFAPATAGVSGETRDLALLQVPGDLAFKVFGLPAKVIWDFSYNFKGKERTESIYGLNGLPITVGTKTLAGGTHNRKDDFAYLVGLQLGENKKKNDWSVYVNYRQVGLASVDPNTNEGTWGGSRTNLRGWKGGVAYNFTDAVVGSLTYYQADNLRKDLYGGQATGGAGIADLNNHRILQVDLNVKF